MKLLNAVAIIALAGAGCIAQEQSQSYAQQFSAVKPELDTLMTSMRYKEVIEKVQAIIPAGVPVLEKDPANPQLGLANYLEMATIQDFHEYLFRALLMVGDTENAIAAIKEAEEIAKQNAVDTEEALTPIVDAWSTAIEDSKKNLDEAAPIKEQLESRKTELEAKSRKSRKEKTELSEIEEDLNNLQNSIMVWEGNLQNAPGVVTQLNKYISDAKRDTTKFAQDIKDMESDLDAEKEQIAKLNGDQANYVSAMLNNKDNFANKDQRNVVRILNRLLFLNPQNAEVQKQLDIALKAE